MLPENARLSTADKGKGRAVPAASSQPSLLDNPELAPDPIPSRPRPSLPLVHPGTHFKTTKPTNIEVAAAHDFANDLVGQIFAFATDTGRSPELILSMGGLPLNLEGRADNPWNNFMQVFSYETADEVHDGVFDLSPFLCTQLIMDYRVVAGTRTLSL